MTTEALCKGTACGECSRCELAAAGFADATHTTPQRPCRCTIHVNRS